MLHFDGIVYSLQQMGGISVMFTEIISRLPRSAYELVGFRESPPQTLRGANYRYERPRRFERYRASRSAGPAELFHSTYYRIPSVRGPRVVTTVYDFIYERYAPAVRRAVHNTQKRRAIRASDRVICISENTRRDLNRFIGTEFDDRVVVIPLGVSTDFAPLDDVSVRSQVLFVGGRAGYKNFRAVVEALGPLQDLKLVCVGGGPFTPEETELLQRNLPGRYHGAGSLTNAQLNLEYNRSICLAYPSLYEGFGIPVLEAMRAGCPVIATNSSSIPEVAGDAAYLLERSDVDEVRSAVEALMVSETRRDLISRGATRSASYSWDETCRRTVMVYEELLGRPIV